MAFTNNKNMNQKFIPNELLIRFFEVACDMEHVLWDPPPIMMERIGSGARHLQPILRSCYEASTTLRSLIDRTAHLWQTVIDIPIYEEMKTPDLSDIPNSVLDVYINCDRPFRDGKPLIESDETIDFVKRNAPRARAIYLRGSSVAVLDVALKISLNISSFSNLLTFNLNPDVEWGALFGNTIAAAGNSLDLNAPRISSLSVGCFVPRLESFPPVSVTAISLTDFTNTSGRIPLSQESCLHLCRLSIDFGGLRANEESGWRGLAFPRLRWLTIRSRSNGLVLQRLCQVEFAVLKHLCVQGDGTSFSDSHNLSKPTGSDSTTFTFYLETIRMTDRVEAFLWLFSRYSFPSLVVAQLTLQETSDSERLKYELVSNDCVVCLAKWLEISLNSWSLGISFLGLATFPNLTVLQIRSRYMELPIKDKEWLPPFEQLHTLVLDLCTLPFLRHVKSPVLSHIKLHYMSDGRVRTMEQYNRLIEDFKPPELIPNITKLTLICSRGIPRMHYILRLFPNVQNMTAHLLGGASAVSLLRGIIGDKNTHVKTPECLVPRMRQLRIRDAGRHPFYAGFLHALKDFLQGRLEAPSADAIEVLHLAPEPASDEGGIDIAQLVKEFETFSLAAFPPPQ